MRALKRWPNSPIELGVQVVSMKSLASRRLAALQPPGKISASRATSGPHQEDPRTCEALSLPVFRRPSRGEETLLPKQVASFTSNCCLVPVGGTPPIERPVSPRVTYEGATAASDSYQLNFKVLPNTIFPAPSLAPQAPGSDHFRGDKVPSGGRRLRRVRSAIGSAPRSEKRWSLRLP